MAFVLGRWATRAGSAIMLAGLLAGIPWALVALVGWPLPREVNLPQTVEQVQDLLATPLTDQMIVNLLALVMWLIWFSFAASFAGEVVAALRGVPSRRLPVVSPMQKVAGWLLSGVTAGVLAAATLTPVMVGQPPAPAVAAAPATLPSAVSSVSIDLMASTATERRAPAEPSPTVCAGEHVLIIDGQRYAYLVQKDDSLWHIAQLCLGDGAAWPQIWELNKGRHFPDVGGTLTDPDLIYPGWPLHLPEGAAPPPGAEEIPPLEPEPPTPPPPPSPEASPTAPPTPTPPPSATPGPSTGQATDVGAPPHSDQVDEPAGDDGGPGTVVPIAFGAALIAATLGVAAAARLRRRGAGADPRVGRRGHQHGHRPTRVDKGAVEQRLQAAAQPLDVDRLDAAMRLLAAGLARRRGSRLPDIIGAHVEQGNLHLLLTEPVEEPPEPPWQAERTQWTLAAGEDVPPVADGTLAALPILVTVGSQASPTAAKAGEYLLLDLERLGCLAITGDADAAQDLLRYLASELAMNTWCDDAEIICAGWSPREGELLTALNPDRVRVATGQIVEQVGLLRQRVRIAAGTLGSVGAADALAGRVHDLAGDSWMPTVLLAADPQPEDLEAIAELASDLARVGRCAVAVVTIGDLPARSDQPEAVHTLTVTPDRAVHVPFLDVTMVVAGLPLHELEPLARVISTAREGAEEPVPPAPEPEPWTAGTDAAGALLPTGDDDRLGLLEDLGFLDPDLPPPAPAAQDEPATDVQADEQPPAVETITGDRPSAAAPEPEASAVVVRPMGAEVDPTLDADLAAWHQPVADRPRIRVLGPVVDAKEVIDAPGQPPKPGRLLLLAEVLVYLAQCGRRGANPTRLDEDLWGHEVQVTYRRATISRARQWAGRRPDGSPWLAEVHYRLEDGYLLDWHLFRRLRARGQSLGPGGAADLRAALELVRGVPLAGFERIAATTRSPYNWLPTSDIDPEHLVAAIVDTAHELAELCLAAGDTAGARWAVDRAWLVDPDRHYDQPWQDILRVHAADGHLAELEATVNELMRIREAEVEEDLDPATYALLRELLPAGYWDSSREREPAASPLG